MAVVLQILPAIVLIVYGLVKQRRWQPYFDMLLMTLPAILFYGMLMGNLPTGPFKWYFYFFAKVILFLLPGIIIIKLRRYKLSDFGITKERQGLSLILGFGILIITTLTNAVIFIQNPEMTLAWTSQFVSPSDLVMIWSIPLFLDAFNEEFLFRGVFFLFAYKNTEDLPLAYIVSMMVAFAWHPLTPFRMIPVFVQGTLLCYLLYKSKIFTARG
ncbi:MAG: CPBP family glutamic-type intramembrane protease [Euryarchaeota archaeon]|nr:CPBP family glutamic-type intramembrane protease [Euryarchaeota archaeon]